MTDFFDDPAFVRDLFDFVLEPGIWSSPGPRSTPGGADRRGRCGRFAGGPANLRRVRPAVRKEDGRTVCMRRARELRLHILRQYPPHSAGRRQPRAATWWMSTRWCRFHRPARRWGRGWLWRAISIRCRTLRNGTPESITAALAECHRQAGPAVHRRRRLRGARATRRRRTLRQWQVTHRRTNRRSK